MTDIWPRSSGKAVICRDMSFSNTWMLKAGGGPCMRRMLMTI